MSVVDLSRAQLLAHQVSTRAPLSWLLFDLRLSASSHRHLDSSQAEAFAAAGDFVSSNRLLELAARSYRGCLETDSLNSECRRCANDFRHRRICCPQQLSAQFCASFLVLAAWSGMRGCDWRRAPCVTTS